MKADKIALLNVIHSEYNIEYSSTIKEYERFDAPDIYILSRVLGLSEKLEMQK